MWIRVAIGNVTFVRVNIRSTRVEAIATASAAASGVPRKLASRTTWLSKLLCASTLDLNQVLRGDPTIPCSGDTKGHTCVQSNQLLGRRRSTGGITSKEPLVNSHKWSLALSGNEIDVVELLITNLYRSTSAFPCLEPLAQDLNQSSCIVIST